MATYEGSRELAESIADVANGAGLPTVALITDMNEPLASAAGNAVEVLNAVDYLTGEKRDARLHEVTLALGAEAPGAGRPAPDPAPGRAALERALARGAAAERSSAWSPRSAGRPIFSKTRARCCRRRRFLRRRPNGLACPAIDAREIGLAVVELGGGRARATDAIDPAVGLTRLPASARTSP